MEALDKVASLKLVYREPPIAIVLESTENPSLLILKEQDRQYLLTLHADNV